jgi:hypothetical protein
LINGNRVEPNNSTIIIANSSVVVLVRLHVAMGDAGVVIRIRRVDVLRRCDHRPQPCDCGEHVKGGAARAEHGAIIVANRRAVKPTASLLVNTSVSR